MASECMAEVMEDWNPREAIIVLVSGDAGFIDTLEEFHDRGFSTFLVSNFDCMSKRFKSVKWLKIWNFFVIAHGDTRKVEDSPLPSIGFHPKFGFRKYTSNGCRFQVQTPKMMSFRDILVQ